VGLRTRSTDRQNHSFDEVIGQLYQTKGHDIDSIVRDFPAEQRARLALFCFSRAHMRDIGVAIAATCEIDPLVEVGAAAGAALFTLSRERPPLSKIPLHGRSRITLAQAQPTGPAFEDIDPEADPEIEREFAVEPARELETVAA
jgi:hypothetical protein